MESEESVESKEFRNEVQNDLLKSLLNKNLIMLETLLENPQVNAYHKYTLQEYTTYLEEKLVWRNNKLHTLLRNSQKNEDHDYSCPNFASCLQLACMLPECGSFVKILLQHVEPNVENASCQPIHLAAERGHRDSLLELLGDTRTNVEALDENGNTALISVCKYVTLDKLDEYKKCLEVLVKKMLPKSINISDRVGYTAFHILVRDTPQENKRFSNISINSDDSSGSNIINPNITTNNLSAGKAAKIRNKENRKARKELTKLMINLCKRDIDMLTNVGGRAAINELEQVFPDLKAAFLSELDAYHNTLIRALEKKHIDRLRDLLKEMTPEGHPAFDPNHRFGPPYHTTCLHYACEYGLGANYIEVLLSAKADPNETIPPHMKSPIHVLCEKGYYVGLQAMFNHYRSPDPKALDLYSNTALHYICDQMTSDKLFRGRQKCLRIMLRQDIDVNHQNKGGVTALMLAVRNNHESIVGAIIKAQKSSIDWDCEFDGMSLRDNISRKFQKLKHLIPTPSQVHLDEKDSGDKRINVQNETARELFQLLTVKNQKKFVEVINGGHLRIYSTYNSDNTFTLLQKASHYGLTEAVRALLNKGTDPNFVFFGNMTPPAVIASQRYHYDVLKIFLEGRKNGFNVNAKDSKGNTALHFAMRIECSQNNLDIVIRLLRSGASLEITNNFGKLPINDKQLQSLLDQCITTNNKTAWEDEYEIIFNYQLIALGNLSNRDDLENRSCKEYTLQIEDENKQIVLNRNIDLSPEMEFLYRLSRNESLSSLLNHPIPFSFISMKWNRIKFCVYANIVVYLTFLLLLTSFIVHCGGPMTHNLRKKIEADPDYLMKKSRIKRHMFVMILLILSFWLVLFLRELVQFSLNMKKYIFSYENYLESFLLASSLITVLIPFIQPDYSLQRILNVITILLSWAELLVLLGQTSFFTKHIQMLKVVLRNYVLPLLCYCCFVVAFGLSFHTLYRGRDHRDEDNDFNIWYLSIMKALVMMTGELSFESFPKDSYFSMVLFLIFVLLETIVIINLLAGLASHGTDQIENAAERLGLITRVRALMRVEMLLVKLHNMIILGCHLPECLRKYIRRTMLFAGVSLQDRVGRINPNRSSELVLGGGSKLLIDKQSFERAMQVISRRNHVPKEHSNNHHCLGRDMLTEMQNQIIKLIQTLELHEMNEIHKIPKKSELCSNE